MHNIAKNAGRSIALLRRASAVLDPKALATVYKSHIRSRMEYCSAIWMAAGKSALSRLDKVELRARKILGPTESVKLPALSHTLGCRSRCCPPPAAQEGSPSHLGPLSAAAPRTPWPIQAHSDAPHDTSSDPARCPQSQLLDPQLHPTLHCGLQRTGRPVSRPQ